MQHWLIGFWNVGVAFKYGGHDHDHDHGGGGGGGGVSIFLVEKLWPLQLLTHCKTQINKTKERMTTFQTHTIFLSNTLLIISYCCISAIMYSPSCCSKPLWLSDNVNKNTFSVSIGFIDRKKDKWELKYFLPTLYKISLAYVLQKN